MTVEGRNDTSRLPSGVTRTKRDGTARPEGRTGGNPSETGKPHHQDEAKEAPKVFAFNEESVEKAERLNTNPRELPDSPTFQRHWTDRWANTGPRTRMTPDEGPESTRKPEGAKPKAETQEGAVNVRGQMTPSAEAEHVQ